MKKKFHLDDEPGPKPVLSVDDLLLGLVHHWSRDRSIFPTEDDRLDMATIMLFQAYTACRPAELVDGSKRRGTGDPLLVDAGDNHLVQQELVEQPWDTMKSQDTGCNSAPDSDCDDTLFDVAEGYETDASEVSDSEDTFSNDFWINSVYESKGMQVDGSPGLVRMGEGRRPKVLCYEDVVLWIVKRLQPGGRDVLAMEVRFRFHKGADRKPKP